MSDEGTTAADQENIRDKRIAQIKPWQFQPGVSGNPLGKPKGTVSMKEWVRKMLREMTDEERIDFLKGLPKTEIWKMAEGFPAQDLTSGGEKINQIPIYGGSSTKPGGIEPGIQGHDGDTKDIPAKEENKGNIGGDVGV